METRSPSFCARSTARNGLLRLGAVLVAALAIPAAASAATRVVDLDGTYDVATNGCSGSDVAFTTINAAYTAAVDGDTIFVCPGTYNETQINILKAITLQGSGAASTIIDAGGGTGLTSAGTIRIRTNTGNVTVDGFTIQNPAAQGAAATGLRFGIEAKSSAAVTFTITNNVIKGSNNPTYTQDYGVYTDGPTALETFVFQHNTISGTGSNPILIERHTGPTDVSFNTFDRGVSQNGASAYFNMSHTGDTITSLQKVSNNTINVANNPGPYTSGNASGAISFFGAFTGTTVGKFTNVEISGNTITGLDSFRRGISVVNNSSVAGGANGEITGLKISCNTLTGLASPAAGSVAIRLIGLITNPDISGNSIDGVETAFTVRTQSSAIAAGVTLNDNSFTNISLYAIDAWTTVPFDAEENWYGSATGPTEPTGNPGGTGGKIGSSAGPVGSPAVDYIPWLGSGNDADAGTCFVPGDSGECTGPSTCDPINGCSATPINDGGSCDDGLFCNGADTCSAGTCGHAGDPCAAGGECGNACNEATDSCNVAAGTACTDDGQVCSTDVCNGAGSCTHPPRAAGFQCRVAGGVCEQAAQCDGSSVVCPANPVLPDSDGDGDCDAIDTCTNVGGGQVFVSRPKSRVVLSRINTETTPGNDVFTLSASFALPSGRTFAQITPDVKGARIVLQADDGTHRADISLPAATYSTATRFGWKRSGNGKTWTYIDRRPAPVSGITRFVISNKDSSRAPRLVAVRLSGKKSTYPVIEADVPIEAVVTLGDASAASAGLCGESAYGVTDCKFNKPKNRLVCLK